MAVGKYVKKKKKKAPPFGAVALTVVLICAALLGMKLLDDALGAPDPQETSAPTSPTLPPNLYGPEDFAYDERGYLSCTAAGYMLGIDVSEQQRTVDWQQVAQAGVEFAFVRIGYRGYTEGGVYPDACAAENLKNAKAAGLKVGVYFYSQALNEQEAAEEAAFCLNYLDGMKLELPVVFDWEYVSEEARTANVDRRTLTDAAITFCEAVEQAGYDAMVYANWYHAEHLMDLHRLQPYGFWLAMYSDVMDYPYRFDLWQYTQTGSVPGIEGAVDINLWPDS